ncbi:hypothetical protein VNO77_01604 [Canavalia gladiata]|uniref:Uncharacterized protein n=1 Tax=Canavalia gladiata TaxID=3824 RepID=A0AAN9R549_CANGL
MDNKIRPFLVSSHSNFFTSLKQVEKRLKLDQTATTESQTQENKFSCLSSPMFLHVDQPSGNQNFVTQDGCESEAPQAFLSVTQEFPTTNQEFSQTSPSDHDTSVNEAQDDDDIERLMQLLGLSEEQRDGFHDDCNSCCSEGGFYSKIVGVEGPKCRKEVVRLDGWIKHFMNDGGEKKEPLRLAHLLLGKAAFISEGADGDFGGLGFPSTIQEFLHTDPPSN